MAAATTSNGLLSSIGSPNNANAIMPISATTPSTGISNPVPSVVARPGTNLNATINANTNANTAAANTAAANAATAATTAATPTTSAATGLTSTPNPITSMSSPIDYTPSSDAVTPNQTVANQFANDTDPNSILMQQANTLGNEQSNSRGLLNSSIGVSASDNAMYNAAMPMATSDAATNANAAIANLSSATQVQLNNLTSQNQQLLQQSTAAANGYNSAMTQLGTIAASSMTAAEKATASNNILGSLTGYLNSQQSVFNATSPTAPNLNLAANYGQYGGTLTTVNNQPTPSPSYAQAHNPSTP